MRPPKSPDKEEADLILKRERTKLVKLQAQAVKLKNDEQAGKLLPRADVIAGITRIAVAMRAFSRRLATELPQLCLGLPLHKSAPLAQDKVDELLRALAAGEDEFWTKLAEAKEAKESGK